MKITFLGTGTSQGIPIIGSTHPVCLSDDQKDKRLRSSVILEIDDLTVLIDCGPDFRQQMLRYNPKKIDALLFTHEHSDHTAGIDDIRPFYFRQGFFNVYADELVQNSLKQRFAYIFETENRYPGAPELNMHLIEKDIDFSINNLSITPISVLHGKLPIFGYRIHNFAYITDAKTIADSEIEKLKGLDVLVVNALRHEEHHSHFTLAEALAFVDKVKPKKTYLTHIGHHLGFHEEVQKDLPNNVFLSYDTLTINV